MVDLVAAVVCDCWSCGGEGRQLTGRRRWLKETKRLLAAAVRPPLGLCRVYADEGDRGLQPVEEGRSVSCGLEGGVLGG